jgi:hypothetical protein
MIYFHLAEKILKVALNNIVLASLMLLKGEAANTNLIVWFEATKDRVAYHQYGVGSRPTL